MYHLSVKPISRAAGRSATAAAAYRAGAEIVDERTGEVHDYTRKGDIVHSEILVPPGAPAWAEDRAALWNAAEAAEKRKDARVARDYEVAIPKALTRAQGITLVRDFAQDLADRYGVAVDFNVHRDDLRKWDGSKKGYQGFHAHILTSTRKLGRAGFGDKADPELSDTKRKGMGLGDGASEVAKVRARWEVAANRHLEQANQAQRIDRRSLKDQGIEREPTVHLGPIVTALERQGKATDRGDVNRRIEAAWRRGIEDRKALAALQPAIVLLDTSIEGALKAREREKTRQRATAKKVETAEKGSTAPAARAPLVAGPAAARPVPQDPVSKTGSLADYSLEDQERVFESVLERLVKERRARIQGVEQKAAERWQRRQRRADFIRDWAPEKPTGLLGRFRRATYQEEAGTWERNWRQANVLAEQAGKLQRRLDDASRAAPSWAYTTIKAKDAAFEARVSAYRNQRQEDLKEQERVLGRGEGRTR